MGKNIFVKTMIIFTIGIFGWLFLPFMKSFFVALLLVIIFTPLRLLLCKIYAKRFSRYLFASEFVISLIETVILISIIFVPLIFLAYFIASDPQVTIQITKDLYNQFSQLFTIIPLDMLWLKKILMPLYEQMLLNKDKITSSIVIFFGNGIVGFLKAIIDILVVIIFFFLISLYRKRLILSIIPILPIKRSIIEEFFVNLIATSATGFYTIIGVAIAQGLAFGIFISFFEGYNPIVLGIMVAIASIIPIFGTALIWIPIALKELSGGNDLNAFVIALYSWAMLSFFIDNILRFLILQQINSLLSRMYELKHKVANDFVIFFSIVSGLITFGFWGFLLGPAIVAFATTTLRLLKHKHLWRNF
jgi:predicted PurR-regulated permease PerM